MHINSLEDGVLALKRVGGIMCYVRFLVVLCEFVGHYHYCIVWYVKNYET
jgi:hypothetical protein